MTFDPFVEPLDSPPPRDLEGWATRLAACPDVAGLPRHPSAGSVEDRDGVEVQVLHNGVAIAIGTCLGPWMTPVIRQTGGHVDPQREAAFAEVLRRLREGAGSAPSLVEIGSPTGIASAWFAREFPGASITCLEADPRYAQVVRATWALNGVRGRLLPGVLGPQDQAWRPLVPETDDHVHPSRRLGQALVHRYSVEELLAGTDSGAVDLLCVDVRGEEPEVLRALRDHLATRAIRWVIVSTTHHARSGRFTTHAEVVDSLVAAGAEIVLDRPPHECLGPAGLVVATFEQGAGAIAEIPVSWTRARDSFHGDPASDSESVRLSLADREERIVQLSHDLESARARVEALEVGLGRAHGERDLLITQLAHARHQRDEAAKGISAVVGRRSTQALRTLRTRVTRK